MHKMWIIVILTLFIISSVGSVQSSAYTNSITTNKHVYLAGENIHISVTGFPNTIYYIYYKIANTLYKQNVFLNSQGFGETVINITLPKSTPYYLNLYNNQSVYVANTSVIIDPITFYIPPSAYTNTYTYAPGETLFCYLIGVPTTQYYVEMLNKQNTVIVPPIKFSTDQNGHGLAKITIPTRISDGNNYSIVLLSSLKEPIYHAVRYFNIQSLTIHASANRQVYLTSGSIKIHYAITYTKNGTLVPNTKNGGTWQIYLNGGNSSIGSFTKAEGIISINLTAFKQLGWVKPEQRYRIYLEYTISSTPKRFGNLTLFFNTGTLAGSITTSTNTGYMPGSIITITVRSLVEYKYLTQPLPSVLVRNLTIIAKTYQDGILWNSTIVEVLQNFTTDVDGKALIAYQIPQNISIGTVLYFSAILSKYNELYMVSNSVTIQPYALLNIYTNSRVNVHTGAQYFLSGDTVVVNAVMDHISNITGMVAYYIFKISEGQNVWMYKISNSSTLTFTVPTNINIGTITIMVSAHTINGYVYTKIKTYSIYAGILTIVPNTYKYSEVGNKIQITANLQSNVMLHPTYSFTVYDADGMVVYAKTSTTNSVLFIVPVNFTVFYKIFVIAVYKNYYASDYILITKYTGYELQLSILSKSAYNTGMFLPGDTIVIHYLITTHTTLPKTLSLHYTIENYPYSGVIFINTSQLQGNFSFTIPRAITTTVLIHFYTNAANTTLVIPIQSNPSWSTYVLLDTDLGTILVLTLTIIALFFGAYAILLQKRRKVRKKQQ